MENEGNAEGDGCRLKVRSEGEGKGEDADEGEGVVKNGRVGENEWGCARSIFRQKFGRDRC